MVECEERVKEWRGQNCGQSSEGKEEEGKGFCLVQCPLLSPLPSNVHSKCAYHRCTKCVHKP